MSAQHVLVVDDDELITTLLNDLLSAKGHRVTMAHDGQDALAVVAADRPDLILSDLDMPQINGYELCRRIKSNPETRLLPFLMITGQHDQKAKLKAWELGADDFLTKPFHNVEVVARCCSLLRIKRLVDDLDSAEAVVFAFARAVEAKSRYTWGHSERVRDYALALARRLNLTDADMKILSKGALIHDIGKISTPDAVLDKPGSLTAEEYDVIKQHPAQGVRIVESLRSVRDTIPLIRWHHERLDGKGYPDGISGGSIPQMARIVSVADVFDALSSERPYRAALPQPECLRILRENAAGGGLDPDLVQIFCEMQTVSNVPA